MTKPETPDWYVLESRKPDASEDDWQEIMSLYSWHDDNRRREDLAAFREDPDPPGTVYRIVRYTKTIPTEVEP